MSADIKLTQHDMFQPTVLVLFETTSPHTSNTLHWRVLASIFIPYINSVKYWPAKFLTKLKNIIKYSVTNLSIFL